MSWLKKANRNKKIADAKKAIGVLYIDFLKSEGLLNGRDLEEMSKNPNGPKVKEIINLAKDASIAHKFKIYCEQKIKENPNENIAP